MQLRGVIGSESELIATQPSTYLCRRRVLEMIGKRRPLRNTAMTIVTTVDGQRPRTSHSLILYSKVYA